MGRIVAIGGGELDTTHSINKDEEIDGILNQADIIYVGGGDTRTAL